MTGSWVKRSWPHPSGSINRRLAKALALLAPPELELTATLIFLRSRGTSRRLLLPWMPFFLSPLNITGPFLAVLKNAIDWASRPYGKNSFTRKPSAVIGTSPGAIGTAVAQQSLRSVLSFCNSPQMNAPEAYIQFSPGLITENGEVTVTSTEEFLAIT